MTPHFSLAEFIHNDTATRLRINNTPTLEHLQNLHRLALALEEVRALLSKPIIVTSG